MLCNASDSVVSVGIPWAGEDVLDALTGRRFRAANGALQITLEALEGMLLIEG